MICGTWLTRMATAQAFTLSRPVVEMVSRTAGAALDRTPRSWRSTTCRWRSRWRLSARKRRRRGSDDASGGSQGARADRRRLGDRAQDARRHHCGRTGHGSGRGGRGSVHRAGPDSAASSGRPDAGHRNAAHGRPDVPAQADGASADAGHRRQLGDAGGIGREHRGAGGRRDRRHRQAGRAVFGRPGHRSAEAPHPRAAERPAGALHGPARRRTSGAAGGQGRRARARQRPDRHRRLDRRDAGDRSAPQPPAGATRRRS